MSCDYIRTLSQLYRCLDGRETRIFQFSSTMRGGRLAIAALPPLSSAVNWIFQFSSPHGGGKLAIAALPPIPSAVKSFFQGKKLEITFTRQVHVVKIFQSDFLSFFPFFRLLVGDASGLSSTKRRMDMCE